jgi:translation initiation factor RLI1
MPNQTSVVDYDRCQPLQCDNGICNVVGACPHGFLFQEKAFELPEPRPGACVGCGICTQACLHDAVRMI